MQNPSLILIGMAWAGMAAGYVSCAQPVAADKPPVPDRDIVLLICAAEESGAPRDSSALVHVITAHNCVCAADGANSRALVFDGHSSLAISNHPRLNIQTNDFCLSFRVQTTATNTMCVLAKGAAVSCQPGYELWFNRFYESGDIGFVFQPGAAQLVTVQLKTGQHLDGQWHQIAVTKSGRFLELYLDRRLVSNNEITNKNIQAAAADLVIGSRNSGRAPFTGKLDEILVATANPYPCPAYTPPPWPAHLHYPAPSPLIRKLAAGKKQHIVAYGTSLTIGGAWVRQLAAYLQAKFPGLVTMTNSGKGGMSSDWGVSNLAERVLAHHPDAVLIEFAINDAIPGRLPSKDMCRKNLETMLDRILKQNPDCEIILMTMNPPVAKQRELRPDVEAYYQVYRDVAAQRGLLLVDHYPLWKWILDNNRPLFDHYVHDTVHPSAEGCANVITPHIIKALWGEQ